MATRKRMGTNMKSWLSWFAKDSTRGAEVLFGIVWLIDCSFKFQLGFAQNFNRLIAIASTTQPSWAQPWFQFWIGISTADPVLLMNIVIIAELVLGVALILGFMRKIVCFCGVIFSMIIWSIPGGFGGPFGFGTVNIGTGVFLALAFILLLVLNSLHEDNVFTLDAWLEKRVKWWGKLGELRY